MFELIGHLPYIKLGFKGVYFSGTCFPGVMFYTFLSVEDFHCMSSHTGYNSPPVTRKTFSSLPNLSVLRVISAALTFCYFYTASGFLYPIISRRGTHYQNTPTLVADLEGFLVVH